MSGTNSLLPSGFEALEPFAAAWAVSGSADRAELRHLRSAEERQAFYNAAKDLLPGALDYLDKKPLMQFDEKEQRLMNLLLSLAHISLAVEVHRDLEAVHTQGRQHMKITRTPADLKC